MKIKDFLKENKLSVGDNVSFLLEKLPVNKEKLLKKLESTIGESAKMSKSKANTVDPEEAIEKYGADTVRLYILFAAPPEQDFEWTEEGIQGAYRFLNRLWNFVTEREELLRSVQYSTDELRKAKNKARELRRTVHEILNGYLRDVEQEFQFNTAIAKAMKLLNELSSYKVSEEIDIKVLKEATEILLLMLSPITPHICSELWERIGNRSLLLNQPMREPDPQALEREEVEIPVQVNGKLRARLRIPYDAEEDTVKSMVLQDERVRKYVDGKELKKFIYIKNKLVNIVLK